MRKQTKLTIIVALLAIVGAVVVVVFFLTPYIRLATTLRPVRVQGEAMKPLLNDGDKIFMTSQVEPLVRGDIVILRYPLDPSKSYIKRIVGLPGEELEIREGHVYINGQALHEPYLNKSASEYFRPPTLPLRLPATEYFVMGDNRNYSSDSRDWGNVARHLIYGKFVYRYHRAAQ